MAAASSEPRVPFRIEHGAIRLDLKLTPKASQTAITGQAVDAAGHTYVKASVTAIPEHGKANAALIKLLAKEWRLAKSQITIIRGQTSTRKTVEIAGEVDKVRPLIIAWLNKLVK
tara:strand:- start:68 stop:412 length:345 start_codon:yes stop_codon:yes gene_type:complete